LTTPSPAQKSLEAHRSRLLELHGTLARSLGLPAVDSILERALAEITPAYQGLDGVEHRDGRIVPESIGAGLAGDPEERVRAAFSALYAAVLVLLSRTVGKEVALRLAGSPDARAVMDGELLGER
jgi:hypothetical protein